MPSQSSSLPVRSMGCSLKVVLAQRDPLRAVVRQHLGKNHLHQLC
jgi:hypothetical protein